MVLSSAAVLTAPGLVSTPQHVKAARPMSGCTPPRRALNATWFHPSSRRGKHVFCRAVSEVEVPKQEQTQVPKPVVKIDNQTDAFSTVVTVKYGDRLGELLDTIAALKNLGLDIARAKIKQVDGENVNKFYITDAATSEKILKSARLEEIRMTILNNLLKYHPESAEELAWSSKAKQPSSRDTLNPLGPRNRRVVQTKIEVAESDNGNYSQLSITTTDRPGLLVDVVRVLKDISVNVVSAEVDTEGPVANDIFNVTYHGEPLPKPMIELVHNALQYYLAVAEIEREESY